MFDGADPLARLSMADCTPMWTQYAWSERGDAPAYGSTWWWRV